MLHADAIAKVDAVALARSAAVGVILPLGEEGGEDTMLHMKHRHMLMNRQLEPCRSRGLEKVQDLTRIQIIAHRDAVQTTIHEELGT